MASSTLFPWILIFSSASALIFGVQLVAFPRASRTSRSTLAILSWAAFLGMIGAGMWTLSETPSGMVWSTDFFSLNGSLVARLGLELSVLGLLGCWLVALLYGYVYFLEPLLGSPGSWLHHPSAILAISSIALSWFSSSLWSSLLAQVLATLSGWLILSVLSAGRNETGQAFSRIAVTFLRERGIGIALVVLGAGVCAAFGAEMDWARIAPGQIPETGALLILLGSLLQLQLFPTMSWGTRTSGQSTLPTTSLLLIGNPSAWASFALIHRMVQVEAIHPQIGLAIALPLVLLTAVSALGKTHLQSAFGILASAIAGMSAAVLLGAGPRAGGTAFITSQLGIWALALFLRRSPKGRDSGALRVAGAILVVAMLGGPGFASAGVLLRLVESAEGIALQGLAAMAWVVLSLAAMRVVALRPAAISQDVSELLRISEDTSPSWRISPLAIAVLMSIAVLWTGGLTGPLSPADAAPWGPDWSTQLFGTGPGSSDSAIHTALWGWMLALVVLVAAGAPESLAKMQLNFLSVPADGYGLSRLMGGVLSFAVAVVERVTAIHRDLVARRLFQAGLRSLTWLCAAIARADRWILDRLDRACRELVEVPAKGLQLMQSGSIQFYILFTVGFTLALLLHFISQLKI